MRRRSCDRRRAVRADRSVINGDRREEAARDVARVAALPEPPSSSRVRAENQFTSGAHRAGSFFRRGTELRELEPSGLASKPKLVSS